jgi:hypothetical protein
MHVLYPKYKDVRQIKEQYSNPNSMGERIYIILEQSTTCLQDLQYYTDCTSDDDVDADGRR